MHDPSFMALALMVSEAMTNAKNSPKVYAAANNSNTGKAIICLASASQARQKWVMSSQKLGRKVNSKKNI